MEISKTVEYKNASGCSKHPCSWYSVLISKILYCLANQWWSSVEAFYACYLKHVHCMYDIITICISHGMFPALVAIIFLLALEYTWQL